MQKGHWKNECPQRSQPTAGANSSASTASSIPTSFVIAEEIPEEIAHFAVAETKDSPDVSECFGVQCNNWGYLGHNGDKVNHQGKRFAIRFANQWRQALRTLKSSDPSVVVNAEPTHPELPKSMEANFVTTGTMGIVDLGASQTVIGDKQVPELLQLLPSNVRDRIQRTSCNLTFRFGNQQTLACKHALLLPLGTAQFRIAIVPGRTPFLLSSSFLKGIRAIIDTEHGSLWSKLLNRELFLERTAKNLLMMDLNQLWCDKSWEQPVSKSSPCGLIFQSEEVEKLLPADLMHPETDVKDTNQESSSRTDHTHDQHMSLPSHDQEMPKGFPTPMPQPSTASFDGVQESTPGSTSTVLQHVEHCPETADLSRRTEEDRHSSRTATDQRSVSRAAVSREDQLWQSKAGPRVSQGIQRSCMDGLVCTDLREEHKAISPDVHSVCGEALECRNQAGAQRDVQQDQHERHTKACRGRALGPDLRDGCDPRFRDARNGKADPSGGSSDQPHDAEPELGQPHDADRDVHAGVAASCPKSERQERNVGSAPEKSHQDSNRHDMDYEYQHDGPNNHYLSHVKKLVRKFEQELQHVAHQVESYGQNRGPRLDLLEVMCSAESELTSQIRKLGGRAERFGRVQGDLQTPEGRKKLFASLATQRPKHLWYSPECKPWCLWSNFNMSRSIACHEDIMNQRRENLWQAALGIVLFRFQQDNRSHFDLEQPRGSAYWRIPGMWEIVDNTYWNEFDLCRVGNLRDPQTQEPIRKRLTVCSTSLGVHVNFHGKLCSGDHKHRNNSGTTQVNGKTMKLSQWTEMYPQKFARQIAKILIHDQKPHENVLVGDADEHPTKKRRLGSKLSPSAIEARFGHETPDINWQTVMSQADKTAPRVGTLVVDSGELLKCVQEMCPHHKVHHLVLCRGTDRYVGPNITLPHGIAPLRRQICIRRKVEDIHVDEWETWESLSNRGLRKKGVSARLSMTIFAAAQPLEVTASALPSVPTSADARNPQNQRRLLAESNQKDSSVPDAKRHCPESEQPTESRVTSHEAIFRTPNEHVPQRNPQATNPKINNNPETTDNTITPHVIDLSSQKHGPMFQQLSFEEQNWLLKLHRNLGHPGSIKLKEFCKQLNCPEHVLKGVSDLRCSTCQEVRGPVISRPSAIHEPCDFGDIVSMDGVMWTNSKGDQFFFYHFLDQSTLFQTAVVAPSHTTEHACKALLNGWFNWAGPPGLLCVDSGTELNSEEFSQFLQRHSVRCRTCAAEAHWQNARTERHGGILQLMLNKMDHENPIQNYEQLASALSHATSTKNQWSKYRGDPPGSSSVREGDSSSRVSNIRLHHCSSCAGIVKHARRPAIPARPCQEGVGTTCICRGRQ